MTAAPAMMRLRYFSKNVGSAAIVRRGRFVDLRRVVVVARLVADVGVAYGVGVAGGGVVADGSAIVSSELSNGSASGDGGGVGIGDVGRGVTGRRERLAKARNSPVGAMARGARERRAKAYVSRRFPACLAGRCGRSIAR